MLSRLPTASESPPRGKPDEYMYRKKLFLNYASDAVESRYIRFLHPRPSRAQFIFCVFSVVSMLSFTASETAAPLPLRAVTFFAAMLMIPLVAYGGVLYCCQRSVQSLSDEVVHRARITVRNVAFTIVVVGMLAVIVVISFTSTMGCVERVLFQDERRAFRTAWCENAVDTAEVSLLTAAFLMQLSLRMLVAAGTLGTIAKVVVWGFVVPTKSTTVAALHPLLFVACFALHVFLRVFLEKDERRRFEAAESLERTSEDLKSRREALQAHCDRVLPTRLSRRASLRNHADVANAATIVCIGFHDFSVMCTAHQMLHVAAMLELARDNIMAACVAKGFQLLPSAPGEFLMIGSLSPNVNPRNAALQGCILAQDVARRARPPVSCAVHVGEVIGAFVGNSWVRYDVFCSGPRCCRSARMIGGAGQVVLTDAARLHVESAVDFTPLEGGGELTGELFALTAARELHGFVDETAFDNSGHNDSSDRGNKEDLLGVARLAAAIQYTKRQGPVNLDDATLGIESDLQGCLFQTFVDTETEHEFLVERMRERASAAGYTWLAYCAFLLVVFFFLLADLQDEPPRAKLGVFIFVACMVMCVLSVMALYSMTSEQLERYFSVWSSLATAIPVGVVLGLSLTRPSVIANDIRSFLVVAALVRSTTFFRTQSQLIAKPLMLVFAHLHLFFPGAILRANELVTLIVVIWSLLMDAEVDLAERAHFLVKRRVEAVLLLNTSEERIRCGLLKATLPPVVFAHTVGATDPSELILRSKEKSATVHMSDTTVVLVTRRAPSSGEHEGVLNYSNWQDSVERIFAGAAGLSIVSAFGDQLLAASPVSRQLSTTSESGAETAESNATNALIAALQLVDREPSCSVLLETDDTIQVSRFGSSPSFGVYGVGVTRLLAVTAAADHAALAGVQTTERVVRWVDASVKNGRIAFESGQPWRIRGVGTIRLSAASLVHATAQSHESSNRGLVSENNLLVK